jgi:hypothetical protein
MVATCKLGAYGCWNDGKCRATCNCIEKVITNADKIRAMSDEELVGLIRALIRTEDCPIPGDPDCDECLFKQLCIHSCKYSGRELEWLKQPVEE